VCGGWGLSSLFLRSDTYQPTSCAGGPPAAHPPDGAEGIEQEVRLLPPLCHAQAPQELGEDFAVGLVKTKLLMELRTTPNGTAKQRDGEINRGGNMG